jgi:hypothetical protein
LRLIDPPLFKLTHVRFWPIASFRGDATTRRRSGQSGLRRGVNPADFAIRLIEHHRLQCRPAFVLKWPENEEAANGGGLEAMDRFHVSYGRPSTLSIWSWNEPVPYSGLPLLVPNEVANVR